MSATSTTLTPHLCCRNAAEAQEFYRNAFGAEVLCDFRMPNGQVMYSALSVNGGKFSLSDENLECGALSAQSLGGSPVTLHLNVADCDAAFQRAVDAGCQVGMPLQDMFWGDRYGFVTDPFGHKWSIATTIRQVNAEELLAAAGAMAAGR